MTILFIIYGIGTLLGYLSYKDYMTEGGLSWTQEERAWGIFISLGSWIMVMSWVVNKILKAVSSDKPASW